MLKSILTLGLIGLLAAPALADRGGRYSRGGYDRGPRTSFGLSLGFSNYGSSFGLNINRGYGGYYDGGYRYAPPLCRPPVIVERPVYVAPPPVVYAPAPVYVAPPVYAAPPVYVAPRAYRPAPVYVAPAPTYYYNGYGSGGYYYYGR